MKYSEAAIRRRAKSYLKFDDNKIDLTNVKDKRRSDQMLDKAFFQKGRKKAARRSRKG